VDEAWITTDAAESVINKMPQKLPCIYPSVLIQILIIFTNLAFNNCLCHDKQLAKLFQEKKHVNGCRRFAWLFWQNSWKYLIFFLF